MILQYLHAVVPMGVTALKNKFAVFLPISRTSAVPRFNVNIADINHLWKAGVSSVALVNLIQFLHCELTAKS